MANASNEGRNPSNDEFGGDAATNSAANADGGSGFRCITCNRGPPYTKKYAKN